MGVNRGWLHNFFSRWHTRLPFTPHLDMSILQLSAKFGQIWSKISYLIALIPKGGRKGNIKILHCTKKNWKRVKKSKPQVYYDVNRFLWWPYIIAHAISRVDYSLEPLTQDVWRMPRAMSKWISINRWLTGDGTTVHSEIMIPGTSIFQLWVIIPPSSAKK